MDKIILEWRFGFCLQTIFAIDKVVPKMFLHFWSVEKWPKNNHVFTLYHWYLLCICTRCVWRGEGMELEFIVILHILHITYMNITHKTYLFSSPKKYCFLVPQKKLSSWAIFDLIFESNSLSLTALTTTYVWNAH